MKATVLHRQPIVSNSRANDRLGIVDGVMPKGSTRVRRKIGRFAFDEFTRTELHAVVHIRVISGSPIGGVCPHRSPARERAADDLKRMTGTLVIPLVYQREGYKGTPSWVVRLPATWQVV